MGTELMLAVMSPVDVVVMSRSDASLTAQKDF